MAIVYRFAQKLHVIKHKMILQSCCHLTLGKKSLFPLHLPFAPRSVDERVLAAGGIVCHRLLEPSVGECKAVVRPKACRRAVGIDSSQESIETVGNRCRALDRQNDRPDHIDGVVKGHQTVLAAAF